MQDFCLKILTTQTTYLYLINYESIDYPLVFLTKDSQGRNKHKLYIFVDRNSFVNTSCFDLKVISNHLNFRNKIYQIRVLCYQNMKHQKWFYFQKFVCSLYAISGNPSTRGFQRFRTRVLRNCASWTKLYLNLWHFSLWSVNFMS